MAAQVAPAGPLAPELEELTRQLEEKGYSPTRSRGYLRTARHVTYSIEGRSCRGETGRCRPFQREHRHDVGLSGVECTPHERGDADPRGKPEPELPWLGSTGSENLSSNGSASSRSPRFDAGLDARPVPGAVLNEKSVRLSSHIAPVLVTGATGNVGRHVARGLRQLGVAFAAGGTDPGRLKKVLGEGVVTRHLDLVDPRTYRDAVRGFRGLFLLRPPPIANVTQTLNVLIDEAIAAGVEHVTFLSVEGADRQRWVPHHAVEAHLLSRGVSTTILRPGFFAQNLGDAYVADIRDHDEIYVPAGSGRVAFVDVRDVAELAARAFIDASLRRQAWTLTGPSAVAFDEVAAVLTQAVGRSIRYRPASIPGYALHLRRHRLPWTQVLVQTLLHVGLRFGNARHVDPTLGQLLGHPPRTIEQYVTDHVELWGSVTA